MGPVVAAIIFEPGEPLRKKRFALYAAVGIAPYGFAAPHGNLALAPSLCA